MKHTKKNHLCTTTAIHTRIHFNAGQKKRILACSIKNTFQCCYIKYNSIFKIHKVVMPLCKLNPHFRRFHFFFLFLIHINASINRFNVNQIFYSIHFSRSILSFIFFISRTLDLFLCITHSESRTKPSHLQ